MIQFSSESTAMVSSGKDGEFEHPNQISFIVKC